MKEIILVNEGIITTIKKVILVILLLTLSPEAVL